MSTHEKWDALLARLEGLGRAAVAFSGGVDSTLLLRAAHDALGDGALALTAASPLHPRRELDEATQLARHIGVRHMLLPSDELSLPEFSANPTDRCYICKRHNFAMLIEAARREGVGVLLEGSNADDTGEYRPGLRAVRELGVLSPLLDAGLTKAEIRALSRELGLPTHDKPAFACLATRIPYGDALTPAVLTQVETAEDCLRSIGFTQFRVRRHGDVARIELPETDIPRACELREAIARGLRGAGFDYITLDLEGFRSGSMDEPRR